LQQSFLADASPYFDYNQILTLHYNESNLFKQNFLRLTKSVLAARTITCHKLSCAMPDTRRKEEINMEYSPQMAFEMKFNDDETQAYQLCSYYLKTRNAIFPNYRHSKTVKDIRNLKRSIIFKHIMKFIKENRHRFDIFQSMLFIRAQLEIIKKIQNDGHKALVEVNMLHGEQADKRWELWKKWVRERNNVSKIEYAFVESNLIADFTRTKNTLENLLKDDNNISNYVANASNILKYVILKKIAPVYVLLSEWVKKLPEQIKCDIYDLCKIENIEDFNLENAKKLYQKYFENELSK
jgi:hypothetical protein